MPLTSLQPPASSPSPQPLILALVLSLRLRTVFPAIRQSATLLVQWCRAQLGLQQTWATEADSLAPSTAARSKPPWMQSTVTKWPTPLTLPLTPQPTF